MKILFLVPKMIGPKDDYRLNSGWNDQIAEKVNKNRWMVITPSILLLASIAQQEGYEVNIVDEEFRQLDLKKTYDIVSIYTVTPNVARGYQLADYYRSIGSWVVMGGVHSLFMQEEAALHCDTLMLGEGEYTFRSFLIDFAKGKQSKRYVQKLGTVDLTQSPMPLYRLLNQQEQQLIPMQTARGCYHNCKFCNVNGLYGSQFRCKSEEQISAELMEINGLEHRKKVYVTNDNIYNDNRHFRCLLHCFREVGLQWYANTDISFGSDEKTIQEAYRSGLREVLIGFESIDPKQLYQLDGQNFKYQYCGRYKELITRIQSNGIAVIGSFMVGKETDREETFKYLEEFIYESKLYGASVTMATPYPGTAYHEAMKKKNRILSYDWKEYTIFQPLIRGDYLSREQFNQNYQHLLEEINSKKSIEHRIRNFIEVYKELKV